MLINLKVKTLDAQTHEFSIDNEITVREFKDKVAERTNIAADQQRIIYCGRVMVDDKQLKDFDLDGKVVHVAVRPPPSQRLPSSDAPSSSGANNTGERRNRSRPAGMRNSPLFRALDGMVVGTMAFPFNATDDNPGPVNPFAASSSFCMNRITVARHMLDCANNIAAYLEDPSRGLNNQPLDILARGRWTMESTVVEVGITSDMPQSQQIVEMVQDAVQAAFRVSGSANVTVLQLPTVFSSNESETNNAATTGSAEPTATESSTAAADEDENPNRSTASVIIEEADTDDEYTPTNAQSNNNSTTTSPIVADTNASDNNENAASGSSDDGNDNSRRRTGTPVLASVVQQMRNVQNRLDPFIDQYFDLLQNETVFEEDDITGRENAQRLYDRVSEAFHYLAHAQHAISDLMLDVSQGTPRYLTCRPILVEQSGYVRSNNFITPAFVPTLRPQTARNTSNANASNSVPINATHLAAHLASSRGSAPGAAAAATARPAAAARSPALSGANFRVNYIGNPNNGNTARSSATPAASSSTSSSTNNTTVDDPADGPVGWQRPTNSSTGSNNNAVPNVSNNDGVPITEEPNPANPARVTTATLPTTSTQTRSTSRPQVHMGNIPVLGMPNGWNGRVIPNSNVSSFDRFLPCNSHHIRESETSNNVTTNDNGPPNSVPLSDHLPLDPNNTTAIDTRVAGESDNSPIIPIPVLNIFEARERFRRGGNSNATSASSTSNETTNNTTNNGSNNTRPSENRNNTTVGSTQLNTATPPIQPPVIDFLAARARERLRRGTWPQFTETDTETNQNTQRLNIHGQLMSCLKNHIFEGQPINDDTIPPAINRALEWFGESLLYLPQYEKPEYDSRDSLFNILRSTLPTVIELFKTSPVNLKEFEQSLKQICEQFRKRLFSVLYICIGRTNAEIFWVQLMRLLGNSIQTNLHGDVVEFLALYLTPTIPSATDEADAQQFIVLRNTQNSNTNYMEMPMDTDVEMSETSATTSQPEVNNEPLPPVVPGSAAWHRHFPNDWLPIITRDIQRQTNSPPNQPPFSDAYISGMSSKRRKLVQNSKSPTEVSALIADSVRKAIQNPGEGTSTNCNNHPVHTPDDVARAIASDTAVQTACIDAVRTNVRERLKKDPDFEAEKFPKSNKFIKK